MSFVIGGGLGWNFPKTQAFFTCSIFDSAFNVLCYWGGEKDRTGCDVPFSAKYDMSFVIGGETIRF